MKKNEEILNRAIQLLCLSDRSALEKNKVNGINYGYKSRENQRKLIQNWLIKNSLFDSCSLRERNYLCAKIGDVNKDDTTYFQLQYECIEPLLWILGLVNETSNYDDFVLTDFHINLRIANFDKEEILKDIKTNQRSSNHINQKRQISMLWYWRIIEINNNIFASRTAEELIISVFGVNYKPIVKEMKKLRLLNDDFIVNGNDIKSLSSSIKYKIKVISELRYHSFEWVFSDADWEEVELNT